jgi:transcriptional regulator with XRE-family HTH domain
MGSRGVRAYYAELRQTLYKEDPQGALQEIKRCLKEDSGNIYKVIEYIREAVQLRIMITFSLNQLFRVARESQKITQRALSTAAGIKQPTLSSFEKGAKGRHPLSLSTLKQIAPLLSINAEYITDQTKNPLFSDNLIKMFFPESIIGKVDFDFIRFICSVNNCLDILFLYSPINGTDKILASLNSSHVYAIALKDSDNNVIVFRREFDNLISEAAKLEDFKKELDSLGKMDIKTISFARTLVDQATYQKLLNWQDLIRDDIAKLFLPVNQTPLLTDEEYPLLVDLLRELKNGAVCCSDIEQLIAKEEVS